MINIVKTEMPEMSNDKIKVLENLGQVIKIEQTKLGEGRYIDAQVILDYLTDVTKTDEDPNEIPERVINKASIAIEYIDGIPAVNGLPIWERLDCETLDFYHLFKIYREQKYVGVNKEKKQAENPAESEGSVSNDNALRRYQRSFENLKEATGYTREALYAISKVYHWQMRVTLYDQFHENFIEKEKNRMITLMENKHRTAAEGIFEKCIDYFKAKSPKELAKMSPKDILGWWSEGYKLQRLSLGLPGDKPKPDKDKTTSAQVINIKSESKTLNLNTAKGVKGTGEDYMQELVDILKIAGALPKNLEAKSDVIEAIGEEVEVIEEKTNETNEEVEVMPNK